MGSTQSIPVINEVANLGETVGETVAAGACGVVGATGASKMLISDAGQALERYAKENPVVSVLSGPSSPPVGTATAGSCTNIVISRIWC